jgi:hypothetical protein
MPTLTNTVAPRRPSVAQLRMLQLVHDGYTRPQALYERKVQRSTKLAVAKHGLATFNSTLQEWQLTDWGRRCLRMYTGRR